MRLVAVCLVVIALAALAGCDSGDPCRPPCDPCADDQVIMFDDIGSISIDTDALQVLHADVEGNILYMRVQYGGGCREHEIRLYGSSGFMESLPIQAALFLSHDANDDPCDALIFRDLSFDLIPLRESYLKGYKDDGPIVLRILEPGSTVPVDPQPVYRFCR
jgi:hypothetical protein